MKNINKIEDLLEQLVKQNEQIISLLKKKDFSEEEFWNNFPIPLNLPYTYKNPYWDKQHPQYIPASDTIICFDCGKNTGIPNLLGMVIPPDGLKCPHCGSVVAEGNTLTC